MSARVGRRGRGGQGGHEPRARIRTRELRVVELTTLGWSQHRIAADAGISQAAVSKILARVEERLLREMRDTLERQKARQTARLELLYTESVQAWERSKADATRRRQRKTEGGGGGATVAEVVVQNQYGDPRFLNESRKTLADLRKLWGLDAPQQLELRPPLNPYESLSDEALLELHAERRRLLEAAAVPTTDQTESTPAPSSTPLPTDERTHDTTPPDAD